MGRSSYPKRAVGAREPDRATRFSCWPLADTHYAGRTGRRGSERTAGRCVIRRAAPQSPAYRTARDSGTIGHGVVTLIWPPSDWDPLTLAAETHAKLFTSTGAQFVTDTAIGAMKSLISAVKLVEERLFR
jgi:hypothetical protein